LALITHRSSLSLVAVRAASRLQLRNNLFTKTGRHQMGRYFFHLWMLVVFFLVGGGSQQALAQVLYGSIVGNVTDQSGASIPRAVVEAKVFETNATFNTTTDEGGLYILTNIPPGTYDITISKPGFRAVDVRKIPVVINTPVRVDERCKSVRPRRASPSRRRPRHCKRTFRTCTQTSDPRNS
jgi:Carboxypeptidase regulatory-like domain